jgi:alanine racemase
MVGAISMDGLVVDVTDAGPVTGDDEFVLIGRQGDDEITADEVAEQRGTIGYEVTTMLRERLPRRHHRP